MSSPLPPAALVVTQSIADFTSWRAAFEANVEFRKANGVLGHHINVAADDPGKVSVYLAVADLDQARAFASSDELRERMRDAGAQGPPEMTWLTPVREAIVWDRELPAFMLSHQVADFDRWLEGYDGAAALQQEGGIVGHAANRSIEDPSVAVVYHQAESFDTLRAFLDDPDLRTAMAEAGVTSAPEVSFWTGGWAQVYD